MQMKQLWDSYADDVEVLKVVRVEDRERQRAATKASKEGARFSPCTDPVLIAVLVYPVSISWMTQCITTTLQLPRVRTHIALHPAVFVLYALPRTPPPLRLRLLVLAVRPF